MKQIGLIAYTDMQALDLIGPLDVFGAANASVTGDAAYQLHIIGLDANPTRTENGLVVTPSCSLDDAPPLALIQPATR